MAATESALKGRACKPLADGSVLFCGGGAAALLDNAVAFTRPHVNYACRDERPYPNGGRMWEGKELVFCCPSERGTRIVLLMS